MSYRNEGFNEIKQETGIKTSCYLVSGVLFS